jgi:N-carbamoyl-D-amino-acid hydrolase
VSRKLRLAAGQLGPIARGATRAAVVARLVALLEQAAARGIGLVVFPELALTTFFPRWDLPEGSELDGFYETAMPGPATQPLFEAAARLGVGFYLGYAERAGHERFNTAILVERDGSIVGKYRKVHLPGTAEPDLTAPVQHLERRYFDPGDLGFPVFRAFGGLVGMAICNDRRWPETYRMLALNGAELMLIGYNTPARLPEMPKHDHLRMFHNHLPMQAGAYQNTAFVVGTAKAGHEEGQDLLAGSCVIAPTGEMLAQAATLGDELVAAAIDLDAVFDSRRVNFDFALYRRPDQYKLISERAGAVPPP